MCGMFDILAPLDHLGGSEAKEEEVVRPDLLQDLDVGAVERADGRRAVQHEFHVAGARGLFARGRNLLAEVRRRDQLFRHRDVVVGGIDHLQLVADQRIVVNNARHVIDKVNDFFGDPIARRRLAAEHLDARHPVRRRVFADSVPLCDGLQDVQQLALVFVDAFDLHVEQRVRVNRDATFLGDPARDCHLVGALGGGEGLGKGLVLDMRLQIAQAVQIADPCLADGVGNQLGQRTVRQMQPAARGYTVGFIDDPPRMQLGQFGEQRACHQIRVQRRDAVDLVRHNEGQLAHVDFLKLHDADVMRPRGVCCLVPRVDAFNDLHVARQDVAEKEGGPPLQRLGQKGVVGVAQHRLRDPQGVVKARAVFVHQKAHQLWPGNRRVGVVHLDRNFVGQAVDVVMFGKIAAQDVLQGR
ncbi:hypothetical protein GALL_491840 [mine drainage metagenome]|uniref:Uncharacterized protein n=1 Tax=mine drainage metagenome TaxID=410659 RepID=A0A1J5PC34_9ZZZZ